MRLDFLFQWGTAFGKEYFWGELLATLILVSYLLLLFLIFMYGVMQFRLAIAYRKSKKEEKKGAVVDPNYFPKVTVQIPLFNEMYVAQRAIENIALLDYPKDKLQIQILDDSTDETKDIVAATVAKIRSEKEIDIIHIHRVNRVGFKAGALDDAMDACKGEFIAIFDVDFLPHADFLKQTISHFKDDKVGVVQTRWGHLNKHYSLLTELQAFGLNAHFSVEQVGRNVQGHYINFNGTGGVWRKSCIEDAGGWQHDTLTEDLDLSYRAQVKGWEFVYLEDVVAPAELPITMSALKSQQHRWMKGGAECFVKNNALLRKTEGLERSHRVHGLFHLFNSSVFVVLLLLSLLSLPLMTIKESFSHFDWVFDVSAIFISSTLFLFYYYWVSYRDKSEQFLPSFLRFTVRFVQFLTVSAGLSVNNSIAVIEGYMGIKSSFVRTPKFNVALKNEFKGNKYDKKKMSFPMFLEFFLFILFGLSTVYHIYTETYAILPFHVMLTLGYGAVFFYGFSELKRR
ncbi:Glycosyltransferase, catalytic subunit of cellulose synthase and poly-beta-1,6-N-acetylglucosamine synthase [Lishizhenia tianjinensis]|uniref:Glycosyltransferase, catalytic subunit of cellulose synthase and poly-beta-1,6-N-acetylglucosamine synthase n=1 Tax=Lishizhenia tianjinensis TaxID=477690 RepID=A0A1I7AR09_9FLAO|nr:cellulose synthase family protein [Lishizhenia tianjinensis]SFT77330.1 Glycosyltransferase, catalytic subunit of cellulose synthase and poly-beta-1,6-N-acetylglucosamine synthase [Lishizhenia tianjinensis]